MILTCLGMCPQDWQVLSPELLKDLQAAGVPVEVVHIVAGEGCPIPVATAVLTA